MAGKWKRKKVATKDDLSGPGIWIDYVNSKLSIPIEVLLQITSCLVDVSKQGNGWECLLVKGIEAAVLENPDLFPHEVKFVYVEGTSVWIIYQWPKQARQLPKAMRYVHNFTKRLRPFDRWTKPQFLKVYGDQGVLVTLKKPSIRAGGPRNANKSKQDKSRTKYILRGAARRAADAGLIPPTGGLT
jgi:hypothetical protein